MRSMVASPTSSFSLILVGLAARPTLQVFPQEKLIMMNPG